MKKAATFGGLAVGVEIGRALRCVMVAALVFVAGCAHYAVNAPLAHHDPATGYQIENLPDAGNSGSLLVVLVFSGGGTRAAALAYGVLDQLAQVEIQWEGRHKRLLDEVSLLAYWLPRSEWNKVPGGAGDMA